MKDLRRGSQGSRTYLCGGNNWRTFNCENHISLCVNCDKGCTDCPGKSNILTPCKTNCLTQTASYAAVHFFVGTKPTYPIPTFSIKSINSTSISLEVFLSANGIIYCKAMPVGSVPVIEDLIRTGVSTFISNSSYPDTLLIDNLSPLTEYDLFCHTQNLIGHGMPVPEIIKYKLPVTTICCKEIKFYSTDMPIIPLASAMRGVVFSFYLNAIPRAFDIIDVSISSCNSTSISSSRLTPNEFSFSLANNNLERKFKFFSQISGCFNIHAKSRDPSSYTSASMVVKVLSENTRLPPPKLIDAQFSDEGRSIYLGFNSDTNGAGNLISSFACSVKTFSI